MSEARQSWFNNESVHKDSPQPSTHLTPDPSAQIENQPKDGQRSWSLFTLDLTPLRDSREFRLLYLGQSVTFLGSMMTFVALPWQVFQLTKSSFAVGMLGVVEFIAVLFMGFVGGALADYLDRRLMVRLTEAALAAGSIVLIINSLLPHSRVSVLFACASLFAALTSLQRPSLEALIPRIVKSEQMPSVAALQAFRGSVAMIGGPAIGGFLVVTFGAALAYSVDLFTFIVSLIALALMQAVPPPAEADRPGLKSIIEGLRYARSRQELLGTYLVDMNAMFFGIPMALFPAIAENYGGASVGFLYAAPAAGSLVVSLMLGWTERVRRHGLAVGIAAACWGLAIVAFGFAGRLWVALLCLAVAGASDMISGVFRMIIWNQTIPDHLRGRLAGIELISYHTGPMLGNAESGIVASIFGIRTTVVSGGILCVLGTGLLLLALPGFRTYDARAGSVRKQIEDDARTDALDRATSG
ncbi:MAG TPA: MFS transporter [Pyrinomonadaceae bacterium]|nr:MFS transporter [Pyrinomonadaceae bacterium]